MKNFRIILFLLATMLGVSAMAQKSNVNATSKTNIVINDNATLPRSISPIVQRQLNLLFYRINEAQRRNLKTVNTNGILMSQNARTHLARVWGYQHMRLKNNSLSLSVYKFNGKYQFINIPVERYPVQKVDSFARDTEVTVDFDKNGQIADFYISMKRDQYMKLAEEAGKVESQEKLDMVIKWVNELRDAYNNRDIAFFEKVMDEKCIIITGRKKETTTKTGELPSMKADRFEYFRQTKRQYINKLKNIFASNKDINVQFDNIIVKRHPGDSRYYTVNLEQTWKSDRYGDLGNLFLLWDFINEDEPMILVRAWSALDDPKKWTMSDFPLAKTKN